MDQPALDDLVAFLPPLLRSLEVLGFVPRHLNPPDLAAVMTAAGSPDEPLPAARARLDGWPEDFADARATFSTVIDETCSAFAELRAALNADGDLGTVYRALRHVPRAQEALYVLANDLAPVNRYFLEPQMRGDAALQERLLQSQPRDDTGVLHFSNEPGTKGGFSLYVPEYYTQEEAWPLVVALHGGSGHGRGFLWSWLRDARSHGAILISPTSMGATWDLHGGDPDNANLARMVDHVRSHWNIDSRRMLLTGMSDGGTFTYVSGFGSDSPFTHLAPIAAAFHPMLIQLADGDRLQGLPIHVTHGKLDWMFPVQMAQMAEQALTRAGARVTYREIADLSHTYPREVNPVLLSWMRETAR